MIINFVDYICLASILEEKTEKQIFTEKMMFSWENQEKKKLFFNVLKFSVFERNLLTIENASDSKNAFFV